ncbi:hypothetical protein ZWY2020_025165 [Hordeum vulgare]|nr:hypothetical protein ZWY2020_025165 [Hordeum vulgare]
MAPGAPPPRGCDAPTTDAPSWTDLAVEEELAVAAARVAGLPYRFGDLLGAGCCDLRGAAGLPCGVPLPVHAHVSIPASSLAHTFPVKPRCWPSCRLPGARGPSSLLGGGAQS